VSAGPTLSNFLTCHFFENFEAYASSARQLIDFDTRYTVQFEREGTYTIGGKIYTVNDNPIRNTGVHYAHAAGLTGAGQTIAISDAGFLISHETLAGKSITLGAAPGVGDHGKNLTTHH
jgi:subtilase-type serine protease